jgi:hypothetical protein
VTQSFTLPAEPARTETPAQRNRRWWLRNMRNLTFGGSLLLTALLGLRWITSDQFTELLYALWIMFGGVECVRGVSDGAERFMRARAGK